MTSDHLPGIDAGAGVTPLPGGASAAAAPADTAGFRRLLESLEKLTKEHREAPPVEDATQLQDAIRAVDDSFVTAMDLRRQLEAAFRGRLP